MWSDWLCLAIHTSAGSQHTRGMSHAPHSTNHPPDRDRTQVHLHREGIVLFNDTLNPFYLRLYGKKEGNVLFIDALNTFYLRLYGVRHMVKDHSDNERGNRLLPHRLFFSKEGRKCFIVFLYQQLSMMLGCHYSFSFHQTYGEGPLR